MFYLLFLKHKTNKFKVHKISAKIYEKTTGNKVDKHKIIGSDTQGTKVGFPVDDIKRYYSNVTLSDQKLSICNTEFREDAIGHLTDGLSVKECSDKVLNCKVAKVSKCNDTGKCIIPSRQQILKGSAFGKASLDHTFTSQACMEHILIFILKSGYLSEEDKKSLLDTHKLYEHLDRMLVWSHKIKFQDIKDPADNYSEQKEISFKRVQMMLAAFLYFDLDTSLVIRYLGNNYTGEYRNPAEIIKILQESGCDEQVIMDLQRLLVVGAPNKMNATSSHQNFLDFFRYGNHSSISKDIEKTLKTMNKEDKNQYLITLPSWIARFIRHLHLTPQGLLCKPGKNDRLIWDGSFIPNWHAICINMMLSSDSEPEIVFGSTFERHLESIWNLRITYPQSDILLFDDDVKGAFRHCKYHPDVAAAFSFIIEQFLFVPLGGTFGSITSPANFEPIARARVHLAHFLSNRRDLLTKYEDIIDKVKFSDPPVSGTKFIQAVKDEVYLGVTDPMKTKYNMFVDDSFFAQTKELMKHAMAASIEALYIILGFPEIEKRQNALSLDKFFESICSYERIQLGININTRKMSIGLTEKKRLAMLDELSHWHKKRRSFTLLQGVILCGSLEFWANTSTCIGLIYQQLRSAVNKFLLNCSKI